MHEEYIRIELQNLDGIDFNEITNQSCSFTTVKLNVGSRQCYS